MSFKKNKKFLFPTEEEIIINTFEEAEKKLNQEIEKKSQPTFTEPLKEDPLRLNVEKRVHDPGIFNPLKFEDAANIAASMMQNIPVIVNLQDLIVKENGKEIAGRIIDYLGGVAYATGFDIKRINGTTFLFTANPIKEIKK